MHITLPDLHRHYLNLVFLFLVLSYDDGPHYYGSWKLLLLKHQFQAYECDAITQFQCCGPICGLNKVLAETGIYADR
jgi:hypothetical protein